MSILDDKGSHLIYNLGISYGERCTRCWVFERSMARFAAEPACPISFGVIDLSQVSLQHLRDLWFIRCHIPYKRIPTYHMLSQVLNMVPSIYLFVLIDKATR